jgi:hypothetical protein
MTWTHEEAKKFVSGGLLYRYKRYRLGRVSYLALDRSVARRRVPRCLAEPAQVSRPLSIILCFCLSFSSCLVSDLKKDFNLKNERRAGHPDDERCGIEHH